VYSVRGYKYAMTACSMTSRHFTLEELKAIVDETHRERA
jgi:hypothetical protein